MPDQGSKKKKKKKKEPKKKIDTIQRRLKIQEKKLEGLNKDLIKKNGKNGKKKYPSPMPRCSSKLIACNGIQSVL